MGTVFTIAVIVFFGAIAMVVCGFIAAYLSRGKYDRPMGEDDRTSLSCRSSESHRREVVIYAEGKSHPDGDLLRYLISSTDSKLLCNEIKVE